MYWFVRLYHKTFFMVIREQSIKKPENGVKPDQNQYTTSLESFPCPRVYQYISGNNNWRIHHQFNQG